MKKISVETFCESYKTKSKGYDKTFEDFMERHITTKYIPVLRKDAFCKEIIHIANHMDNDNHNIVKINSFYGYVGFVMRIIDLYTDIEISFKDGEFINQYDQLNELGAIRDIINHIPEAEYAEFRMICDMELNDLYENEYSTTALLYNLKQSFSLSEEAIGSALEVLANEQNVEQTTE